MENKVADEAPETASACVCGEGATGPNGKDKGSGWPSYPGKRRDCVCDCVCVCVRESAEEADVETGVDAVNVALPARCICACACA